MEVKGAGVGKTTGMQKEEKMETLTRNSAALAVSKSSENHTGAASWYGK